MASGSNTQNGFPHYLSPEQQQLLLQALASGQNKQAPRRPMSNSAFPMQPTSLEASPEQPNAIYNDIHASPYMDNYDLDFGIDTSFDFDASVLSNPVPDEASGSVKSDTPENEGAEKREREEDEDEVSPGGNDAKRRENGEKVPKKPGRKPLTSEPTSKRKAQNRAAQRAFRERKEKHLKDLESKVIELEKKSSIANSQNNSLRKQLETVTAELNEYKRKVRLLNNARAVSGPRPGAGNQGLHNLNNIDFQFEFPKFGYLPGPPQNNNNNNNNKQTGHKSTSSSPSNPSLNVINSNDRGNRASWHAPGHTNGAPTNTHDVNRSPTTQYDLFGSLPVSRTSLDSGHYSLGSVTTGSPSGSSHSNLGPSSSCGTSPEPHNQSPMGFKPVDTMTTIGEEQPHMSTANNGHVNHFDPSADLSFDWLAQQNGGQFDPQLFSNYREPQNNILNFEDSFFSDALDADFLTPYNMPHEAAAAPPPQKNLIAQINEQQEAIDPIVVKNEPANTKEDLNCVELWNKIQTCDKVQSGGFDLDSLCSELQTKAKCSGEGPTVQEQEFETILGKYLGDDFVKKCGFDRPGQKRQGQGQAQGQQKA